MPLLPYANDIRLMAGLLIVALGLAFLLNASRPSWPYARWLAGSAAIYGCTLALFRLGEIAGLIDDSTTGTALPLASLLAIATLAAGLQARFRPGGVPARRVFIAVAVIAPLVILSVSTALPNQPFAGPISTAMLFFAGAAWMVWLWRRERWGGQLVFALVLLTHPALVLFGLLQGLDLQQLRQLLPIPIVLAYVFVMTLILQRDAQMLDEELQQRARAEEELQRIAATLEDTVQERTTELHEIVQGLQSFAGMVSHDLSGPLRNAGALVHMARNAAQRGDKAEMHEALTRLERETQRAQSMVSDLLSLSRVEQTPIERAPVDTQALFEDCLQSLAVQHPNAAAIAHAEGLPVVMSDAGLLHHVLTNLIGNALKFGQARNELRVSVRAQRDGEVWRFTVADNGPGFDPARSADLFRPFSRLQNTPANGTGLGLTVVKRVVQRLGGEVGAASSPGLGATFWWTLPAASDTQA
jgi:signal transduction histidine kinase